VAHATVRAARIRYHSPELSCDISRRIGWTVDRGDGKRGKIHKTSDEARREARGQEEAQ